jgi:hypothetical protein
MTAFVVGRMCASKARYDSERQALRVLNGRREEVRRHLHVYACPKCSGWHVGHRTGTGGHRCEAADGLAAAWAELRVDVIPAMRGKTWSVDDLRQDDQGRWQAVLQGPTRSRHVLSNRNCPTAAAAVRDLIAKARASRWYAPHEIGGRIDG